jgi:hypothetical protein
VKKPPSERPERQPDPGPAERWVTLSGRQSRHWLERFGLADPVSRWEALGIEPLQGRILEQLVRLESDPTADPQVEILDPSDEYLEELSAGAEPAASPSFVLGDPAKRRPIYNGKPLKRLTKAQYDVVKAVLEAGPEGLTNDDLVMRSRHGGAVNDLKRLLKSQPVYSSLMAASGRERRGYRWIGPT